MSYYRNFIPKKGEKTEMNPSYVKSNSGYKTPHHDKMQAVISKNPRQLLHIVMEKINSPEWQEVHKNATVKIEIEKPIFNNNYLVGIVDGVVDLLDHAYVIKDENGTFNGRKPTENDLYRRVIYDVKPHLDSVSQLIGQLKTYAERLKYNRHTAGGPSEGIANPDMVVITRDTNTGYESMLEQQSITVVNLAELF